MFEGVSEKPKKCFPEFTPKFFLSLIHENEDTRCLTSCGDIYCPDTHCFSQLPALSSSTNLLSDIQ